MPRGNFGHWSTREISGPFEGIDIALHRPHQQLWPFREDLLESALSRGYATMRARGRCLKRLRIDSRSCSNPLLLFLKRPSSSLTSVVPPFRVPPPGAASSQWHHGKAFDLPFLRRVTSLPTPCSLFLSFPPERKPASVAFSPWHSPVFVTLWATGHFATRFFPLPANTDALCFFFTSNSLQSNCGLRVSVLFS